MWSLNDVKVTPYQHREITIFRKFGQAQPKKGWLFASCGAPKQ
jgi:hypothetical protein